MYITNKTINTTPEFACRVFVCYNRNSDISNPVPESQTFKIKYNIDVVKNKTFNAMILNTIKKSINETHECNHAVISQILDELILTSKQNITSSQPALMPIQIDENNVAVMHTSSSTEIQLENEHAHVSRGKLCVAVDLPSRQNAHVLTNVKCLLAEYTNTFIEQKLQVCVLLTPTFKPMRSATIQTPNNLKTALFVTEKYVIRNDKIVHIPASNKLRYVADAGLISPAVLPIQKNSSREQNYAETRHDHREFLRSLGCARVFGRASTGKGKDIGNIITWCTHVKSGEENNHIISVYVPIFW